MNKSIIPLVSILLLISISPVFGQTTEEIEDELLAGITPSEPIQYIFQDLLPDGIALLLADESNGDKSLLALEIADERALEAKVEARNGNFDAVEWSQSEHDKALGVVEETLVKIESNDNSEELKTKIRIEQKIESHNKLSDEVKKEIDIKIEIEGNITEEQLNKIREILANIDTSSDKIKIKIEIEKDETKVELEVEDELEDFEIEKIHDDLEDEVDDEIEIEDEEKEEKIRVMVDEKKSESNQKNDKDNDSDDSNDSDSDD